MDEIYDKIIKGIVRKKNEEDFVQKFLGLKYSCKNCCYERMKEESENYFCFQCTRCGGNLTYIYCYDEID